jgi:hypothetical protein
MKSRFEPYPEGSYHPCCDKATTILQSAHRTASSFLDTFGRTRKARGARGTPTDQEHDLLRAMLTFASSGLDSMIKQLVRDALPKVIDLREGAQDNFQEFVDRRLRRGDGPNYAFVAAVMADPNPRKHLLDGLVRDLTSSSLQSVDGILRVGSYFDIPSPKLIPDANAAREIFAARNEIVHEMDIDFERPNRNRRPRKVQDMEDKTQALFEIAHRFLTEVNTRLIDDEQASE